MDGCAAGAAGGAVLLAGLLAAWALPLRGRPKAKKAQRKAQACKPSAGAGAGLFPICSSTSKSREKTPAVAPLNIFHGLHLSFEELRAELPRLAAEGYDALQLPPAQRSQPGDLRQEWFLRYQPLRYGEIDPHLGGEAALRRLCGDAAALGVMVIADCVFNHCAVVASRAEWEAAQQDEQLLEGLKRRIDCVFGPELNRDDFQWPWVCLEGAKWDDPRFMYEGWGCGEWSELRWSTKVLEVHYNHLRTLLRCGVRGFRLDAAKHMRPRHVHRYVEFLQKRGAFVYVEVLSLQRDVHMQYEFLGDGSARVPSTDFLAAAQLRSALRGGDCTSLLPRLAPLARPAAESVRFVRNHDTVLNGPGAICGIDWRSPEEAQAAWAYLLSLPGGCALVYSDDRAVPAVRRAVAFRRLLAERLGAEAERQGAKAKAGSDACPRTQVTAWPPPAYSLVLVVPTGPSGNALGLVALNFARKGDVAMQLPSHLKGLAMVEVLGGQLANGEWQPHLSAPIAMPGVPSLAVPPNNARFFVMAEEPPSVSRSGLSPQVFTLFYFSGWESPHLHFGLEGRWTTAPGWPLEASPPPPPGLGAGQLRLGQGEQRQGRWWRVDVPMPEARRPAEFVLNNGSAAAESMSWDKSPQNENYAIPGPGTYALDSGRLLRLGGGGAAA